MGDPSSASNMMSHLFLMLTLIASIFCAAFPTIDVVVPEKIDFFEYSTSASFIQAMKKSGGTEKDCHTFATTTIASIKETVQSEQGTLDAVDTGSGCVQEGQLQAPVGSTASALSA